MTRAELLELLKKARKQLKKHHVPKDEQTVTLSIDTLENALSEQPQIVRCKNCKHRDPEDHKCDCGHDIQWQLPRADDWFCADGEHKEFV